MKAGQVASIDTGATETLTLVITSVEPVTTDSAKVVARLGRCHDSHCLSLASGSSYAATAALGSRSLASYALPRP